MRRSRISGSTFATSAPTAHPLALDGLELLDHRSTARTAPRCRAIPAFWRSSNSPSTEALTISANSMQPRSSLRRRLISVTGGTRGASVRADPGACRNPASHAARQAPIRWPGGRCRGSDPPTSRSTITWSPGRGDLGDRGLDSPTDVRSGPCPPAPAHDVGGRLVACPSIIRRKGIRSGGNAGASIAGAGTVSAGASAGARRALGKTVSTARPSRRRPPPNSQPAQPRLRPR